MSRWTKFRDKVTKPVKDLPEAAGDVAKGAGMVAGKVGKEAGRAVEGVAKGAGDAVEDVGKVGKKVVSEVGKAAGRVGKAVNEGAEDLTNEAKRLIFKTRSELGRAYTNVEELASASYHFIENQVDGYIAIGKDAVRACLQGQIVDVVYQLSLRPWKVQEESTFEAIGRSRLLKYYATAAASVYGGPAGAAAFAAWYTYRCTGDLELAVKAGAIASASSMGTAATADMQSMVQRTLVSASIGGAAIAASGGSRDDVLNAFVRGSELGAIRAAYKDFMEAELTGEPATGGAVAKLDEDGKPRIIGSWKPLQDQDGTLITDADGNAQIDITSMPKSVSHVGFASSSMDVPDIGFEETSALMQAVAKLPYFNDMAYFHDQWMAVAQQGGLTVPITVLPAIIIVGAAADPVVTGPPTDEIIDEKPGRGE